MVQRQLTILIDDVDGKELKDGAGETVTFALDGTSYEIDLSKKNADTFRGAFQDYIAAGRKVTGARGRSKAAIGGKSDAKAIRQWAKDNGHVVPERGRIPATVREAYEAAN